MNKSEMMMVKNEVGSRLLLVDNVKIRFLKKNHLQK